MKKQIGIVLAIVCALLLATATFFLGKSIGMSESKAYNSDAISELESIIREIIADELGKTEIAEDNTDTEEAIVSPASSFSDLVGIWTQSGMDSRLLTILEDGTVYYTSWYLEEGFIFSSQIGYIDENTIIFTGSYDGHSSSYSERFTDETTLPYSYENSGIFAQITRYGSNAITLSYVGANVVHQFTR